MAYAHQSNEKTYHTRYSFRTTLTCLYLTTLDEHAETLEAEEDPDFH